MASRAWRALGVEAGKGAEWFFLFETHGQTLRIRSALMTAPATMLMIDPDADRWREMFPHPTIRAKFDHMKASGFLMRECWSAQVRKDEAEKATASVPVASEPGVPQ